MFALPQRLIEKLSRKSAYVNDTSVTCSYKPRWSAAVVRYVNARPFFFKKWSNFTFKWANMITVCFKCRSSWDIKSRTAHQSRSSPLRSSNGNRQTVLSVTNRRINQMALCKPAIIFFYGLQKPMKLALQLAPFTTSADGVSEFWRITLWKTWLMENARFLFLVIQPLNPEKPNPPKKIAREFYFYFYFFIFWRELRRSFTSHTKSLYFCCCFD